MPYFIFNVNAGMGITNNISNFVELDATPSQTENKEFGLVYSAGAEAWLGKNYVKQVFCLAFTSTNSNFVEQYHGGGISHNTLVYSTNLNIVKRYETIDIAYGWLFPLPKNICFSIQGAFNYIARAQDWNYGYTTLGFDTTYYKGRTGNGLIHPYYFSFRSKLLFNFRLKNLSMGTFALVNWGIGYTLPYCVIGLQYYPFRKMR